MCMKKNLLIFIALFVGLFGFVQTQFVFALTADVFRSDKCDLLTNQFDRFSKAFVERDQLNNQIKNKQFVEIMSQQEVIASQFEVLKRTRLQSLSTTVDKLSAGSLSDSQKKAVEIFAQTGRSAVESYFAVLVAAQATQRAELQALIAQRNTTFDMYRARRLVQINDIIARAKLDCATIQLTALKTQFKERIRVLQQQEQSEVSEFSQLRTSVAGILEKRKVASSQALTDFKSVMLRAREALNVVLRK